MSDKRLAILNSTLKLICERGFHDSPISIIAKEAGVSIGIIYHYFNNKEELIANLYSKLKLDFAHAIVQGYSEEDQAKKNLHKFWMNTITYLQKHPDEANFMEQYDHSPSLNQPTNEEFIKILAPFFQNEFYIFAYSTPRQ